MQTRFRLMLPAILLAAILSPELAICDPSLTTTIIVVRHAEKQNVIDDPDLTPAGEERSRHLREMVLKAGVTGVYATQYRRTQETVAPLANALGLETKVIDAREPATLAADILSEHRGGIVVVAGHSNTVPDIIAALGAPKPVPIDERDYSNIFVVTVPASGPATALRLTF